MLRARLQEKEAELRGQAESAGVSQAAAEEIQKLRQTVDTLREKNASLGRVFQKSQEGESAMKDAVAAKDIQLIKRSERILALESRRDQAHHENAEALNQTMQERDQLRNQVLQLQQTLERSRVTTQEFLDEERERSAKAERQIHSLGDQLKVKNASIIELRKQIENSMQGTLEQKHQHRDKLSETQRQLEMTQAELDRVRLHLQETVGKNEEAHAGKQQEIYELNSQIRQLKSELSDHHCLEQDYAALKKRSDTTQQDLTRNADALENVEVVVEQLQDKNQSLTRQLEELNRKNLGAAHHESTIQSLQQEIETANVNSKQLRTKLTANQKYVLRLESREAALRQALERTLEKVKGAYENKDHVDRRYVNNLLVRFFERWQKGENTQEVLDLMARILQFTDEQCTLIGESNHKSSLVASAWGFASSLVFDPQEEAKAVSIEQIQDRPLTDLWIEFLLDKEGDVSKAMPTAEDKAATKPPDPPDTDS